MDLVITHDQAEQRFIATVPGGVAVLAYQPAGAGTLDFVSTVVPLADRGRGIGVGLVHHALAYARSNGFKVIPTCWFVDQIMRDHPEYADLAAG